MLFENEYYIIHYNECDLKSIDKILTVLNERVPKILSFFKIQEQPKVVIKLYDKIDEYKNNLVSSFKKNYDGKRVYQSWMIANTEDGNINMQSLDLVKKLDDFENYTEEEFCFNVAHEFVHKIHSLISSNNPGWFWEVLATHFGNPECQHATNTSFTYEDLMYRFDEIDGYGAVYKFGEYLFANYDEEFIFKLVKDNELLESVSKEIIEKINEPKKTF